MINMIKIKNLIPFSVHDGSVCDVKWESDKLYFSIKKYEDDPLNKKCISLCFFGVEWIRSVCDENHDGYVQGTDFSEYPLIDKNELNENYKEFVSYGLLDDVFMIDENVVCVNDIFFFYATDVKIL